MSPTTEAALLKAVRMLLAGELTADKSIAHVRTVDLRKLQVAYAAVEAENAKKADADVTKTLDLDGIPVKVYIEVDAGEDTWDLVHAEVEIPNLVARVAEQLHTDLDTLAAEEIERQLAEDGDEPSEEE